MAFDISTAMSGVGDAANGAVSTLSTLFTYLIIILVIAGIGFVFLMFARYSTRVIILRQRGKATEYLFGRAYRNLKRGVYSIKIKGLLDRKKNLPLPPSDDLIAKNKKNDLIVVREQADGSLTYCTHPDVSGMIFKTISADYKEFDRIDEEATNKRYSSKDFWKENAPTILLIAFCVIFFILGILLMGKMSEAIGAAEGVVELAKSLNVPQIGAQTFGGNVTK